MDDYEDPDYYSNYTYTDNFTTEEIDGIIFVDKSLCDGSCVILLLANGTIFLLGVLGNGVVIWISGLKMKKSVNTTWYLSLAVSDFIFCICLPFMIVFTATSEWVFGLFMCKFTSFIMFLNMFSSIFLLVLISVDRCVSVVFPVWSQNHRSVRAASVLVVLAWALAVFCSIPAIIYRETRHLHGKTVCRTNYHHQHSHSAVAFGRFVFGFVIPFIIITFCYTIIILKLKSNRMTKSSKPFKVMSALIVTFFICWLPYHVFTLMEINPHRHNLEVTVRGLKVATVFAYGNSFLNPILYVFMGNDFKQRFKNCLFSKIENAIGEEGRTMSRYLSRSSSMDGRASTHI